MECPHLLVGRFYHRPPPCSAARAVTVIHAMGQRSLWSVNRVRREHCLDDKSRGPPSRFQRVLMRAVGSHSRGTILPGALAGVGWAAWCPIPYERLLRGLLLMRRSSGYCQNDR
jgi:hypothetical protein